MAHHRVEFLQFLDAHADARQRNAHLLGHHALAGLVVGHELVQRRIEQAYCHRQAAHLAEQALKVSALYRQQLGQRLAAAGLVVGQDHFAHRVDALTFEEHVLGARQANAGGAKAARNRGFFRRVGVGAHFQAPVLVAQGHQRAEVAGQFGILGRDAAFKHFAGAAVQ